YAYTISSNSYRADFEVLNPGGSVDLYISTNRFPPPSQADNLYASEKSGASPEFIAVFTNSVPPLVPVEWLLAVTNKDTVCVDYSVRVTEYGIPRVIPLTNAIPYSNTVQIAATNNIDLYSFVVSSNAIQATFELFNLSGDANLYGARSVLDALAQANGVANVQPGTRPELIVLVTNGAPVA